MRATWILALWAFYIGLAMADEVKDEGVIYSQAVRPGLSFRAWNMKQEEREGHIYLNVDWQAAPWAGIAFQPVKKEDVLLTVTEEWVKFGYVRFRVNGLANPYGQAGAPRRLSGPAWGRRRRV